MATTTPNFGWTVPTSTDLVKDGATAIELLGDSIDGAFVDLKGGTTGQVLAKASGTDLDFAWVAQDDSNAIQNAIVDAKGDLIGATAADTPARLAVGANGTVLTADSTAATGLAWSTPASGGATLISTTTLSGSTTTLTFDSSYKDIYMIVTGVNCSTNSDVVIRYNSGSVNGNFNGLINKTLAYSLSNEWPTIGLGNNVTGGNTNNAFFIYVHDYNSTAYKPAHGWGAWTSASAGGFNNTNMFGFATDSAAITQLQVVTLSGSFNGGTARLFGVK